MTAPTPSFTAQLIGRTEKSLNALLARVLAGTGLTEPQWVTLSATVRLGDGRDRGALIEQIADIFHVPTSEADGLVESLARRGLVRLDANTVSVSAEGTQLFAEVSGETQQIVHRLWGDLPADELRVAASVLDAVLAKATAELATT